MTNKTLITFLSLLSILTACGGPGDSATVPVAEPAAASSVDIGEHVVHFSAQTTDQLPSVIAQQYNILRSKNRAMLNVSVLQQADGVPVTATVTVKAANLTGQIKSVTMREIREPGETVAIYYIGDTSVANRETLIFDIKVQPEGVDKPADVRFKREFYSD